MEIHDGSCAILDVKQILFMLSNLHNFFFIISLPTVAYKLCTQALLFKKKSLFYYLHQKLIKRLYKNRLVL